MTHISRATLMETLKFGLVGGSGVLVNFLVLSLSLYVFNIPEPIALALGIIFSMSSNYLLNRVWTFSSENAIRGEYIQYVILNGLGILIQYIVALSLEFYFDSRNFEYLHLVFFDLDTIFLASFCGILLGFISNFLFSKYLVFN